VKKGIRDGRTGDGERGGKRDGKGERTWQGDGRGYEREKEEGKWEMGVDPTKFGRKSTPLNALMLRGSRFINIRTLIFVVKVH